MIYEKELEYTVADNENLFFVVPKGIIKRYIRGHKELLKRVNRLFRQGKISYPLFYKKDLKPVRFFYVVAAYFNQYKKYHKMEKTSVPVYGKITK